MKLPMARQAYIVIRKEKHIADKFWVCEEKADALKIAGDVADYWMNEYQPEETDRTNYGDLLFHCHAEDAFRVSVEPATSAL